MNRLTTTIKRQYLSQIIDRTKKIEHRKLKKYWTQRLATVTVPFEMRLINGMSKSAPEVTVRIDRVRKISARREYDLHIGKIIGFKHWDARRKRPR